MYEHNICCSKLVEDLRSPCLRVFRPYFMLTYVKRGLPVFRLKRASSTYYSIFHMLFFVAYWSLVIYIRFQYELRELNFSKPQRESNFKLLLFFFIQESRRNNKCDRGDVIHTVVIE